MLISKVRRIRSSGISFFLEGNLPVRKERETYRKGSPSVVLVLSGLEDDARGTDRKQGPVFDHAPFLVAQQFVTHEGTCIAGPITQDIFQFPVLVPTDIDHTMGHVNAGLVGLDRAIDATAFHVSPDDVLSKVQRDDLFIMKNIFNDDDRTHPVLIGILVRMLVALQVAKLRNVDADAELLATLRANESQYLSRFVLGLVENDVVVALRASYSLHRLC